MNKEEVKEFMDWAITPNTVAVMVISQRGDEFKSAIMNGSGKYDLDAELGVNSVGEYLSKHNWINRTKVPEGLTTVQQVEWIKKQGKQ